MLPTVSWPANRPSYRTTHGRVTPRRASLRIVLTIAMYGPRLVWYSGVSGLVGSHGRSQAALRTRVSRQMRASVTLTGRRTSGAGSRDGSVSVIGQPRIRPMEQSFPAPASNARPRAIPVYALILL